MSAIRAYVGGEGLWSKAQKEATNNLLKYSISFNESDYKNYLTFLQVPLGDKQARLELNKENPNIEIVRTGFIKGGNHSEDVDDLIFLYRWFRNVSYMDIAIKDWTQGDVEIEELVGVGEKIHAIVRSSVGGNEPILQATKSSELVPLIDEIYRIDKRLTVLENHFSATLSEGARRIRDILFAITVAMTIILGSIVLVIAIYIGKISVRVDKIKSEFVSRVSHELRTPLTAIIGITSMILKGEYSFRQERLNQPLQDIKSSSLHLLDLVNDLLEISRMQSGKLKLNLGEVNMRQAIERNVQIMQSLAQKKDIKIVFSSKEDFFVLADLEKVEQILYNLLGNAIKFTSKGKIEITMLQKGDKLLTIVRDTGEGIAKNERKRLFGRFEQTAIGNSSSHHGGLGLGLYLSRALARKMGGDVWLESSEVGLGSTFAFELLMAKTTEAKKLQKKLAKEFV